MVRSGELSQVIVLVNGFEGQDESICVVCVRGEGIEPAYDPSAE